MAVIVAIAGAIGAVSSCNEKVEKKPSPAVNNSQSMTVNVPPQATATPSQDLTTPNVPAVSSSPAKEVTSSSFASVALSKYRALKALNETPVKGDSGEAAYNRLSDARRKVELASFLAANTHLLEQLTGHSSDVVGALEEARRLSVYEAEAARLEASLKR